MKRSQLLLNTLKEVPAEAEVLSHKLMLRAGMIRKLAAGVYDFLPLAVRVLRKVEQIVREEMNRSGAQEVLLPAMIPAALWEETGRWEQYGKELLRIKDRHGRDFCYGPTHEEVITDLVRREVRSYKQLPLNLYQIQTKFRDEIRPRFGVMRAREFIMKDGYSFDTSESASEATYRKMYEAYTRIFERCGLRFRAVDADSGNIGGSFSHEFMVLADSGEDQIASCSECDYAANLEKAEALSPQKDPGPEEDCAKMQKVHTPGKKSVDEISSFIPVNKDRVVKTLLFETGKGVIAALVRGDHDLNETKLKKALDTDFVTMAEEETVRETTGSPTGFAGPQGLKVEVIADLAVREMKGFVTGANEKDHHYINVTTERDFNVSCYADIRNVVSGDKCPKCDGTLELDHGIEVGHIFKLGTKYSKSMGASFLNPEGKEKTMVMGCYGIGVSRIIAASIEQNSDDAGIIWPFSISPFQVIVMPLNINHEESVTVADTLYQNLCSEGVEALYDDRKERAGMKFKDADLLGIPLQVVVGERTLKEGMVEIKNRRSGVREKIAVENLFKEVMRVLAAMKSGKSS